MGLLRGLPATLVITGGADVLRDEGERCADKLREAGVEVTSVRVDSRVERCGLAAAAARSRQPGGMDAACCIGGTEVTGSGEGTPGCRAGRPDRV
nr:hypothetical protein StreXyl84_67070 [Streptomyces sp. Xyl84]